MVWMALLKYFQLKTTVPLKCNVALARMYFPRISILISRQVLAQILRESSEELRLMLRTRLVELDHSREFRFVARVINSSSLLQLDHSLKLFV